MSWEPTLLTPDGSAIGTPDQVRESISRAFPNTEWELAPGGEALLEQFEHFGSNLSDEWRTQILQTPPHWHGLYDSEDVSVEFHLGFSDTVQQISITSRGNHAVSQRRLRAIADENGWLIRNDLVD